MYIWEPYKIWADVQRSLTTHLPLTSVVMASSSYLFSRILFFFSSLKHPIYTYPSTRSGELVRMIPVGPSIDTSLYSTSPSATLSLEWYSPIFIRTISPSLCQATGSRSSGHSAVPSTAPEIVTYGYLNISCRSKICQPVGNRKKRFPIIRFSRYSLAYAWIYLSFWQLRPLGGKLV